MSRASSGEIITGPSSSTEGSVSERRGVWFWVGCGEGGAALAVGSDKPWCLFSSFANISFLPSGVDGIFGRDIGESVCLGISKNEHASFPAAFVAEDPAAPALGPKKPLLDAPSTLICETPAARPLAPGVDAKYDRFP